MNPYWKRFLATAAFVLVLFVPAMILDRPLVILAGPWFGVILIADAKGLLTGVQLSEGLAGLLTLLTIGIAASSKVSAIAAAIFFLWNAAVVYSIIFGGIRFG